jgi:ABC-2 type transport system permease protein
MPTSVAAKTLFEQRRAILWWSLGTIAMVMILIAYYPSVRDDPGLNDYFKNLPEAAQALSGGVNIDFSTPDGWLNGQLFANVGPLIFIIFGILLGSSALGREEDRGTAELLLTLPVSRRRVVTEKALASLTLMAVLGAVLVLTLVLGTRLFDMDVGLDGIVAASIQTVLLGSTFGALALLVSAALGPHAHGGALSGAAAFGAFLLYGLAQAVDSLRGWDKLSPFYWFQDSDPIGTGFDLGHLLVLAAATAVLTTAAVLLFDRRDVYVA